MSGYGNAIRAMARHRHRQRGPGRPRVQRRPVPPGRTSLPRTLPGGDLHLRQAIDLLAAPLDPASGRREFVDYRDLEIRHLGSIYEGLLEYRLRCAAEPLVIVRQKGKERYEPAAGAVPDVPAGQVYLVTDKGERKATGSYYTPDYIVQYIVEQTVGPVLAERTARFRNRTARSSMRPAWRKPSWR